MSFPSSHCGECPYYLAFGESTEAQDEAIIEHCKGCSCTGKYTEDAKRVYYAGRYLSKMMRAAKVQMILRKAIHEEDTK